MLVFFEELIGFIAIKIYALGYWGISIGMLIESACIPLPSEVVLPLAGVMASNGVINLVGANIAVGIGSMIGSLAAYTFGYFGGRSLILKYGKYILISEDHFFKAEGVFNKYGGAAVFFGRLLPVIRTFISLPAGIARMDIRKFIFFSLAGMIPWNFILIYLGYLFGENYATIIRPIFKKFEYAVIGICVLIFIGFIIWNVKEYRKKKK